MADFKKGPDGSITLATFTGCQVLLLVETGIGLCIEFRADKNGDVDSVQVLLPPDEALRLSRLLETYAIHGMKPPDPGTRMN